MYTVLFRKGEDTMSIDQALIYYAERRERRKLWAKQFLFLFILFVVLGFEVQTLWPSVAGFLGVK